MYPIRINLSDKPKKGKSRFFFRLKQPIYFSFIWYLNSVIVSAIHIPTKQNIIHNTANTTVRTQLIVEFGTKTN